jgi:hypothetical protein
MGYKPSFRVLFRGLVKNIFLVYYSVRQQVKMSGGNSTGDQDGNALRVSVVQSVGAC